jgi:hypothetical protein
MQVNMILAIMEIMVQAHMVIVAQNLVTRASIVENADILHVTAIPQLVMHATIMRQRAGCHKGIERIKTLEVDMAMRANEGTEEPHEGGMIHPTGNIHER